MKILFFSDHFYPEPSAPAAHVFERARFWAQWGHQVTVICAAPNFPEGKVFEGYTNAWRRVEDLEGVRVVRVKTLIAANEGFFWRTLDYLSYMCSALFFSLFEDRPDVVVSSSPHIFVGLAGLAGSFVRRCPHVLEVRDLWPASIGAVTPLRSGFVYRLLEKVEAILYRRSSRIISLTQSFVEHIRSSGVPENRIDVVINGANLELFSPRPRDEKIERQYGLENRFVVGYVGTLGLAHGLESLIEAARLVRDRNVVFFFVGVGAAKDSLRVRVDELGLHNVVFAPRQEKSDVPRFLSVCDVSLIHLRGAVVFEKVIPSKIFEAMAMGLPVLYVGPDGEGPAIVRSHEAGLWLPPGNPHALARAVEELASEPKRVRSLAEASLAAAPLYSRERQARSSFEALAKAVESDADSASHEGRSIERNRD